MPSLGVASAQHPAVPCTSVADPKCLQAQSLAVSDRSGRSANGGSVLRSCDGGEGINVAYPELVPSYRPMAASLPAMVVPRQTQAQAMPPFQPRPDAGPGNQGWQCDRASESGSTTEQPVMRSDTATSWSIPADTENGVADLQPRSSSTFSQRSIWRTTTSCAGGGILMHMVRGTLHTFTSDQLNSSMRHGMSRR